jgi:UDP-N-acetylmuramate: L-alanyl-gamma-D-glutamyl-meso-diaminopimelate ligase
VRGADEDDVGDDQDIKTLHLMGICGTGMGAFAGLLKAAGYDVRGSDQGAYPPMSLKLQDWGIEVRTPYGPDNLEPPVDLVVVGNVIPAKNPEATAMRERELPHASFPHTFGRLFLDKRHSVVVAGTHGKTTTSTLLAHILLHAGRDPGYLVGGIPTATAGGLAAESFRVGRDAPEVPFVVEGDEYDTAYFDKGPKFLHYRPKSLLCTSLEFDHADIYDSVDQIRARFAQVLALVPDGGHIVLHAPSEQLTRALTEAEGEGGVKARVETYGEGGDYVAADVVMSAEGIAFDVVRGGETLGRLSAPMSGQHNVDNLLGAYAILVGLGLSHDAIAAGAAAFGGVARRMTEVGEEDGVLVIDDFAHHPTAVATTVAGARARYPGRPIWALYEPRSATSCRKVFQAAYPEAFDDADQVLLAPPGRKLEPAEALDVPRLAADLTARGVKAEAPESIDAIVARCAADVPSGAVVLCMSNGAFGGIHGRLLEALAPRRTSPKEAT